MDEVALQAVHKTVKDGLRLLQLVYENGNKATNDYHKSILILSIHYLNVKAYKEAQGIVRIIPASYFQNVLPQQMKEDAAFAALACRVAQAFVDGGLAESPTYHVQNEWIQRPADA